LKSFFGFGRREKPAIEKEKLNPRGLVNKRFEWARNARDSAGISGKARRRHLCSYPSVARR
jgi:hypothetical protein